MSLPDHILRAMNRPPAHRPPDTCKQSPNGKHFWSHPYNLTVQCLWCASNRTPTAEEIAEEKKVLATEDKPPTKWEAGKERELQDMIETYARQLGCYVVRPPMHKRSQLPKGYPDLTIMRDGRALLIEAKADGGRVKPGQEQCHAELRAAGMSVLVAFEAEAALAAIREFFKP